jgi:hypothetical protein
LVHNAIDTFVGLRMLSHYISSAKNNCVILNTFVQHIEA